MNFEIRTLRWASILTGLLLIIALSACSDSNAPAEDAAKSTATPTGTAEDTARSATTPTGTAEDAAKSTATPTGTAEDTARSATTPTGTVEDTTKSTPDPDIDLASLDEFINWCVQNRGIELYGSAFGSQLLIGVTLGEVTERLDEVIKTWESRTPPSEVSDLHNATLSTLKTWSDFTKEFIDESPGRKDVRPDQLEEEDQQAYLLGVGLAGFTSNLERVEALRYMPAEVRDRLVAGACVDESLIEELGLVTELTVGESVEATLDNPDEGDEYFFRVKQGERYVIEVVNATLPDLSLSVSGAIDTRGGASGATGFSSSGMGRLGNASGFWLDEGVEQSSTRAVALSSGVGVIEVSGSEAGSYTLTVRADRSPSSVLNVSSAWEDSGVRINWDPVDGADYYIIYHDEGRHTYGDNPDRCFIDVDGRSMYSCNELASNVVETTFVHTTPEGRRGSRGDLYWVAACNSDGCSDTAPKPAIPEGQEPSAIFGSGTTPVATPPQPTPAPSATPARTPTPTPSATPAPQSTPASSSPTDRARFEADTPPGYTAVALSDDGRVWGNPTRYTTDSDHGTVAYMLLGKLTGCNFANLEADRQSTVHIRVEQLGSLSGYESETVCRATSKSWNAWDGLRITHIRFFDESNEGGVREHEVAYSGEPDSPTPTPTPTPSATPAPTPTTMQSATPTETIPAAPANVRYAVEGSAVRVSWDPVEGADYYNLYHDDFFDSNCFLNVDGTPLL